MSQVFGPWANTFSRVSIFGAVFFAGAFVALLGVVFRSPYEAGVGDPVPQPVEFSHAHHVGEMGFDCRYCHATADTAAFAGMPSTATCLTCHAHVLPQSPLLAPVRQSAETGRPIRWNRVYDLPDFTYFNHAAHVQGGFGCETCHGPVDRMEVLWKAQPLTMEWCLDCHREPEKYIRPREAVYQIGYQPAEDQAVLGPRLAREHAVQSKTSCSYCHY
jgi:hypothetical protein